MTQRLVDGRPAPFGGATVADRRARLVRGALPGVLRAGRGRACRGRRRIDSPTVSDNAAFDYASRRRRLPRSLEAEGIAALFLGPSADLEYLTGVERPVPSFGQPLYAHGWVTGAFFRPGAEPVFVLPRMFAAFDLREQPEGEVLVVNETDDGFAIFERVAARRRGLGSARGRRPGLGRDDAEPRAHPRRSTGCRPARGS